MLKVIHCKTLKRSPASNTSQGFDAVVLIVVGASI